jgi:transposase
MKTVERKASGSKLELAADERIAVGVDVDKRRYHVAVWSKTRGLIADWVQGASPTALLAKLAPIAGQIEVLAYEAGPTGFGLARAAQAAGIAVIVAAPSRIPAERGRRVKTDRLDCIKLAQLAALGLLKAACIPSEQEEADRAIGRVREQLTRKARRVKQQIKSSLLFHGWEEPQGLKNWTRKSVLALRELPVGVELRFCLDQLLDELEFLSAKLATLTAKLKELAQDDRHREPVERMMARPGVGLITAMTVRLELIQPERLRHSGQAARLAGLAPGVSQSGNTRRGGPILKSGNGRIRAVMVEAAWRAIRYDPDLHKRYLHLCMNTGSAKKAIVAIARHLVEQLWRLMVQPAAPEARAA